MMRFDDEAAAGAPPPPPRFVAIAMALADKLSAWPPHYHRSHVRNSPKKISSWKKLKGELFLRV
jgi:hypothetical protein